MMGDPLGSSRVSSQKQNREGVVGAHSGQYRVTMVERARDVVDSSRDVTWGEDLALAFRLGEIIPNYGLRDTEHALG
ncbi:hypothetical protein ACFX2B_023545 [Malus domestica]